jgi:tight adherence protein C
MDPFLGAALFILIFAACLFGAQRFLKRPNAAVTRVLDSAAPVRAARVRKFTWSQIPVRIGSLFRGGQKRDRLKQDLAGAGIKAPNAEALYQGAQVIGTALGLLICGSAALIANAEASNLIMLALGGSAGGFMLPGEVLKRRIARRRKNIAKALPNALDLLTIGVEAGLGLDQAVVHVSKELTRAHPEISEEFYQVHLETRAGKRRSDALRSLAERTSVLEVKKLVAVLIQADRFGTSIAQSMRAHAEHLRVQSRQTAEEKAAKLGVKLVFPIFFFILPSLFVITVGPVVVRIVRDLLPMMNNM